MIVVILLEKQKHSSILYKRKDKAYIREGKREGVGEGKERKR